MTWVSLKNEGTPKEKGGCMVDVRLKDGSIRKCYYHEDGFAWRRFYCSEDKAHLHSGSWQDSESLRFYQEDDVESWYRK